MCPRLLGGGLIPEMIRSPLPSWGFDPALAVFAEAMAIRAGTLFAGQVAVQGNLDGTGTPDVLRFDRGAQVHNTFYESLDPKQGSLTVIWTPEKDRDATQTNDEYLWRPSIGYLRYEHDTNLLRFAIGGQGITAALSTAAGMTYCIEATWDCNNPPDGSNYARVSINNVQTYGMAAQPTVAAPDATLYLGSSDGNLKPANALFEGTAFCRLPLWDGDYGVDINGSGVDIIAALAAGGYEDLAKLIPAWHIPFFLPTNATPGALTTTGQAWGWDFNANILGAGPGYCSDGYYGGGEHAVVFNNTNTSVDCGSDAALDNLPAGANGFTIEGWYLLNSAGESYSSRLFSKHSVTDGWEVSFAGPTNLTVRVRYDDTDASVSYIWTPDSKWHHWALTYDEGGDRKSRLWLDGIVVATSPASVGNYNADAALDFLIGEGDAKSIDGKLGWSALSDTIRYAVPFTPPVTCPTDDANYVGIWPTNEGTGVAIDNIGTKAGGALPAAARDGTLTNGTWQPQWVVTSGFAVTGCGEIASSVDQVFGLQGYEFTTTSTATGATGDGISISLAGQAAGSNYLLVLDAHEAGVTTTGAELLTNEGFETKQGGGAFPAGEKDDGTSDDFANWMETDVNDGNGNKCEASATVPGASPGTTSVKFTNTNDNPYMYQNVTVVPGARYALTMQARGDGAVDGQYQVLDVSNGYVNILGNTATGVTGAAYALVTAYFTAPRACTVARIILWAPLAAGVCYFDDVSVKLTADDIRISILDDTAATGAMFGTADQDFGAGSGYIQMAEEVITFKLPETPDVAADCTAFTLKVLGTIAGQTVYLHQVLLYENLIANPSMEGTYAGVPPIPPGWVDQGLEAGDAQASSGGGAVIHSGSEALQLNVTAVESVGPYAAINWTDGDFLSFGGFLYGDGTTSSQLRAVTQTRLQDHAGGNFGRNGAAAASWTHLFGVGRAAQTGSIWHWIMALSGAAGARYADDAYAVPLLAKTLTVTPRTQANSTEGDWLTIDGHDSAPQPIPAGAITATRGHVKIKIKPRHDVADMLSFGETQPRFFALYANGANYAIVYISAANTVQLRFNDGGGIQFGNWAAAGALIADGEYLFEVKWNPARMWLIVNGVTYITINQPVNFAVVPTVLWPGTLQTGIQQIDAAFAKP